MDETKRDMPGKKGALGWVRKSIVPLSGLIIAIAIIVTVGYVYLQHPEFFDKENLKKYEEYAYLAAFLISVFLNATVIIPVSNMAVIMTLGAIPNLSPLFVGLAGGIGAAIGEITGYVVGRSGRDLLAKNKMYLRVENWVKKWGFIAVVILSIFPLLFDIVGIIAGAMRMPVWRFFIACWLGRTISYVTVAYLAHWGIQAIPSLFG